MVLSWLNAQFSRLKVYVSNRVNQILELTNVSQWNYVRTNKNPADMIPRGTNVAEISLNFGETDLIDEVYQTSFGNNHQGIY